MNEKDFIYSKSKELHLSGIKNFPIDFTRTKNFTVIEVPDKELVLGKEFFGSFEVSSVTGDFTMNFNSEYEAKYFVYASRNRNKKVKIPAEISDIKTAVSSYEKYLDNILQELQKDYIARFHSGKNFTSVSSEIFKKLNLTRL